MSRVWTWRQAIFESTLQATTKLVLQALASHLNDMGGPMFPSQERLAKLCTLSERSVITHLQIAEDEGWIVASKRALDGKKWAANEYVARFPQGVKEVHPLPDGVKDVHPQGEAASLDGVKDVHTNSPSELSIEHSNGGALEKDFSAFWEAYPKKVSKPDALKAWKRLKPDLVAVLAGLRRWKASEQWIKDGGKFIPNPATWLNRENWRDVVAGDQPQLSAGEIEEANRRLAESKRRHDEEMRQRTEAHRRSLGLIA